MTSTFDFLTDFTNCQLYICTILNCFSYRLIWLYEMSCFVGFRTYWFLPAINPKYIIIFKRHSEHNIFLFCFRIALHNVVWIHLNRLEKPIRKHFRLSFVQGKARKRNMQIRMGLLFCKICLLWDMWCIQTIYGVTQIGQP